MKIAAFATLQIVLFAGLAQARPEVLFPVEAEISNLPSARLLEVAELKDFTPEAFAEISKILIWQAESSSATGENVDEPKQTVTNTASAGSSKGEVFVTRADISKKMRSAIDSSLILKKANLSFNIPEKIKLTFAKASVSKTAAERGLKNTLAVRCATCIYQIRISSTPTLVSRSWSIDYDQDIKNGAFMLPIQDTSTAMNQWISGSYRAKNKVPVLKRAVRFGERVQGEDFELGEADVTFQREATPELSQLVGMIANRSLQARAAVVLGDFKKEPAAHRGQVLKAIAGTDSFEVSINVTAEENGAIGDLIKVQNPETKKMMSGLIVDKGVVKVQ
jgi:flagella basal body P-ring formation protein FlgA